MNKVTLIARVLLGLNFLVVGLNGLLHFMPEPQESGVAAHFLDAMNASHYMDVIWVVEIVSGALLVINRFVPAALAILAAVLFNIAIFHIFMARVDYAASVIAIVLWAIAIIPERGAFRPLLTATPKVPKIEMTS